MFLKPDCSFYLGGHILEYVTEVFLYYNFSMKQFIESLKVTLIINRKLYLNHFLFFYLQYCLIEHLYLKPLNCLCVVHESAQGALFDSFDKKTLKEITKLRSTNYKLKIDENFKVLHFYIIFKIIMINICF